MSVALGEIKIPVISPEDLIVTKILAGRPRDIEDVSGILAERSASLNMEQIRATLLLIEEALGQSNLTPLFEAELQRTLPRP